MSASRDTYNGRVCDLAALLLPFVQKSGVSFCTYPCEGKKVTGAALNFDSAKRHFALLKSLHEAQPNLSFKRSTMEDALKSIVKDLNGSALKLKGKDEIKDFITTMSSRIRCMCRAISQGEKKNPCPKWVAELPWRSEQQQQRQQVVRKRPAGNDTVKEDHASEQMPKKYVFKFNEELLVCVRQEIGTQKEEPSMPMKVDDSIHDDELAIAKWSCGFEHHVPGLTMRRLRSLAHRSLTATGDLWTGPHTTSKLKVSIAQRCDRTLLMSLYESQKQILQVNLALFGPCDPHHQLPRDHPKLSSKDWRSLCQSPPLIVLARCLELTCVTAVPKH